MTRRDAAWLGVLLVMIVSIVAVTQLSLWAGIVLFVVWLIASRFMARAGFVPSWQRRPPR